MESTPNFLQQLEQDGFVILPEALPLTVAETTRIYFQNVLQEAIQSNDSHHLFAKINSREFRHDLRLMMTPQVHQIITGIISQYKDLYTHLFPLDSKLVELGVITAHPGAEQQMIHSDVDFDKDARLIFTTFVALQDVASDMGPTLVWPGTHSQFWCEFYKPKMLGPVDSYYEKFQPQKMTLSQGNAVLIDTRVMHAGGANVSKTDRMLFHFSFETTAELKKPSGFTYNLMPALKDMHTLSDFF